MSFQEAIAANDTLKDANLKISSFVMVKTCHQNLPLGKVVDLCSGSGSGMIAALRMGFSAIGIDKSTIQTAAAKERIETFIGQEVSASGFAK
ncbi:TPA: hypothetical protein ACH3X1_002223 [Trebouxia sp. C0004]